jgi:hypothetical protein
MTEPSYTFDDLHAHLQSVFAAPHFQALLTDLIQRLMTALAAADAAAERGDADAGLLVSELFHAIGLAANAAACAVAPDDPAGNLKSRHVAMQIIAAALRDPVNTVRVDSLDATGFLFQPPKDQTH